MSPIRDDLLKSYGYTLQWYLTDIAKYLALWSISEASERYGFSYVLGGGTALNDIYFPKHKRRFSRDIDLYLVNTPPMKFTDHINTVLRDSGYYREISVLNSSVIAQGLIYEGVERNNITFKFRLMLPSSVSSGIKFTDIVPGEVKEKAEFSKWYMEMKNSLPRVYEVEVTVFTGEKRYVHEICEKTYDLPVRNITDWINLPEPYYVKVFAVEDLLASKIEGIISAMVAKGVVKGKITGRREVKSRDIYDIVIAFLDDVYDRNRLLRSLEALNIDSRYAFKAIRLAMLQTLVDVNKHMELVEFVPSMRGRLRDWVYMVLEAYEKTLLIYDQTPDDYIAYKLVLDEEIDVEEVKRRFNISSSQISHILSKLEKLGIYKISSSKRPRNHLTL